MTTNVVLVPGFWLGAWAWKEVAARLRAVGLVPHPVTLPGLDPGAEDRSGVTLADQVAAVVDLVTELDDRVVLAGHSGGAAVVSAVVDTDPGRVSRVVYVDAGPLPDGSTLDAEATGDLTLPAWEELDAGGDSTEGLDGAARERLRAMAVPEPHGVLTSTTRLSNPARKLVPVTVVCCSMPSAAIREAMAAGAPWAGELIGSDVELIDLPTGHWPMFSRPADLADILAAAARA